MERFREALAAIASKKWTIELPPFEVYPGWDPRFGELISDLALELSKTLRRSPGEVSEQMCSELNSYFMVKDVFFAQNGFINCRALEKNHLELSCEASPNEAPLVHFIPPPPLCFGEPPDEIVKVRLNSIYRSSLRLSGSLKNKIPTRLISDPQASSHEDFLKNLSHLTTGTSRAVLYLPHAAMNQGYFREILKVGGANLTTRVMSKSWCMSDAAALNSGAFRRLTQELERLEPTQVTLSGEWYLSSLRDGEMLDWEVPFLQERANVVWYSEEVLKRCRQILAAGAPPESYTREITQRCSLAEQRLLFKSATIATLLSHSLEKGALPEFFDNFESFLIEVARYLYAIPLREIETLKGSRKEIMVISRVYDNLARFLVTIV